MWFPNIMETKVALNDAQKHQQQKQQVAHHHHTYRKKIKIASLHKDEDFNFILMIFKSISFFQFFVWTIFWLVLLLSEFLIYVAGSHFLGVLKMEEEA